MKRWLGTVAAIGVLLGVAWLIAALDWHFGWRHADNVLRAASLFLLIALAVWGVLRVVLFHPLFDRAYREWLERTPWNCRKPLPKGPVHLVLQDAVFAAVGVVLLWILYPFLPPLLAAWMFAAAYLLGVWVALWPTGQWSYGYAVGFGAGAVLMLVHHQAAAWAAMGALLVIAHLGLRRSLAAFPWDMQGWRAKLRDYDIHTNREQPPEYTLGWPYDRIGPNRPNPRVEYTHALFASLLVGWLLYALDFAVYPLKQQPSATWFGLIIVLFAVLFRLVRYLPGTRPPLNISGRLARLRWLVSRYDVVFLGPAAAVVAVLLVPLLCSCGLSPQQSLSVCTALALFLVLAAGPGLTRWRLTAPMQLVPGAENQQRFVKL
jgi:hypothetical protein